MNKELKNKKPVVNEIIDNTMIQKDSTLRSSQTGYASIDKPWLSNYPNSLISSRKKFNRIIDKLKSVWTNPKETIINYYDTEIKVEVFFENVYSISKSLIALGVKQGDSIVVSLEAVPEFIELLLASEMVGCSIKSCKSDIKDVINFINQDCTVNYYITHDYLSTSDSDEIYNKTSASIITINPLFSIVNKNKLRDNIIQTINSKYTNMKIGHEKNMSWDEFLKKGKGIETYKMNDKYSIKLFSAFTSGSTGVPKEVIHSSESIMGIVNQLTYLPFQEDKRDTWLHTILPPTLVAVIVSMMCYPLAAGKVLILDPYCRLEDLDLELMYYEPNGWALIPLFITSLLESNRIPEEYDMSYFKLFGFGAEPATIKVIKKAQDFLDKHNCQATLSSGYGQSEGGSGFTTTFGKEMILSGSAGFPLIDTIISIVEPNTINELKYYEVGEICKTGPGIMLGYSDEELTKQVLKKHSDGNIWLHTGDIGYMTNEGLLFVLGRKGINVYPDKLVFPLEIENKVVSIEGVKDAIIVPGEDHDNKSFEVPYLFIVPENDVIIEELLIKVNNLIDQELSYAQKPKGLYVIDKKPIKNFKVDRMVLQKKYNLI